MQDVRMWLVERARRRIASGYYNIPEVQEEAARRLLAGLEADEREDWRDCQAE